MNNQALSDEPRKPAHPLKSADGERHRYYCDGGPLNGFWLEHKSPVDHLQAGWGHGHYTRGDHAQLLWRAS